MKLTVIIQDTPSGIIVIDCIKRDGGEVREASFEAALPNIEELLPQLPAILTKVLKL